MSRYSVAGRLSCYNKQIMEKSIKIFIASDHAGFHLKNSLKKFLKRDKYNIQDLGAYKYNSKDDYPDYAYRVCTKVLNSNSKGILVCGTGQGMAITAIKYPELSQRFVGTRDQVGTQ